jgi:tape measure domain-containing protein
MNNETLFTINLEDKATSKINTIGNELSKLQTDFNKMCNMQPFVMIGNLLAQISDKLSVIGQNSLFAVNNLRYLNDTTSKGLKENHKNFDKLNETIKNTGKNTSGLDKAKDKVNEVGKKAKESTSLVSKFSETLSKIGAAGFGISAISGAFSAIGGLFGEGMSRQNAVSDFETLLYGDKEAAQNLAEAIRSTDAATLYGTDTMNEAIKQMVGYGVDTETSFQMSEALGDIAMGDKNKMGSLSMAFSQMYSLGKLQTQDWKQMVGAGFNPFNQMEKDLGKSKDELQEMMEKGKITSDMVKDAFMHATQTKYFDIEGKVHYAADEEQLKKAKADFEKANEEIAKKGGKKKEWQEDKGQYWQATTGTLEGTLSGKLAKLQSKFGDLKARLFDALAPVAEKLIDLVSNKIFPMIEKAWPIIDAIGAGIGWLTDLIIENWDAISDLAIGIGSVVGAIMLLTSPMTWIIVAIGALTAGIIWLYKNWEEWYDWVVAISPPLAMVIDMIKSVKSHWDSIVDGFKSGGMLEGIKRLGLAILDGILKPVQRLLEMIGKIPGLKVAGNMASGIASLRESINAAIPTPEPKKEDTAENGDNPNKELKDAVNGKNKGGSGTDKLKGKADKGTKAAVSGGQRNTTVNIHIQDMVKEINFNGTLQENEDDLVNRVSECMTRVLYATAQLE